MTVQLQSEVERPNFAFLPKECEFVHGAIVEGLSGAELGAIAANVATLLNVFVRPLRLGRVFGPRAGYYCFPHEPLMVRKPAASYVRMDRMADGRPPIHEFHIPPDLAVEILSPAALYEDMEEKVNDYLKAGVRLVWIISPGSKTVLIRRPDGTCAALSHDGELSGEQVLPGFACKVAELFV